MNESEFCTVISRLAREIQVMEYQTAKLTDELHAAEKENLKLMEELNSLRAKAVSEK